jgi:uncharacterized protein YceH (UPF0502 family)
MKGGVKMPRGERTGMGRGSGGFGRRKGFFGGRGGGWWQLVTGGVAVASYLFDYFSKRKKLQDSTSQLNQASTATPEDEEKQLESQLAALKAQINAIERRLAELRSKKA